MHHILFGFRNASTLSTISSDGTILLGSQLRHDAQRQATSMRGFDEDHLSILTSELLGTHLNSLLTNRSQTSR